MNIETLNETRRDIPDAMLILEQENKKSTKPAEIYVNRSILSAVSEYFRMLFYTRGSSPKKIADGIKEECSPETFNLLRDAIFSIRKMVVKDINLFSGLIDAIYAMDVNSFISKQSCDDALTILEMCHEYLIKVPYVKILKELGGNKNGCFHHLLFLLDSLDEITDENVPWISKWVINEEDLKFIKDEHENEDYIMKIKYFIAKKLILVDDKGTIAIYNYKNGTVVKLINIGGEISGASFSNSLDLLALLAAADIVNIYDRNFSLIDTIKTKGIINKISFSPGGMLAIVSDSFISFFDINEYPLIFFKIYIPGIKDIEWRGSDMFCVVSTKDKVNVIDINDKKVIKSLNIPNDFDVPQIKANELFVTIYSENSKRIEIFLWENLQSFNINLNPLEFHDNVINVAISPYEFKIAVHLMDGTVLIMDIMSRATLYSQKISGFLFSFTPEGDGLGVISDKITIWYFNTEDPSKEFVQIIPNILDEKNIIFADFMATDANVNRGPVSIE